MLQSFAEDVRIVWGNGGPPNENRGMEAEPIEGMETVESPKLVMLCKKTKCKSHSYITVVQKNGWQLAVLSKQILANLNLSL